MSRRLVVALFLGIFLLLPAWAEKVRFLHYSVEDGLPQSWVTDVVQDPEGYLWVSMESGGVARFDGTAFEPFSQEEGLADLSVRCLLIDRGGRLLAGGTGGVARWNGSRFERPPELAPLDREKILCMMQARDGGLWFGTDNGLYVFDGTRMRHFGEEDGLSRYQVKALAQDASGNVWLGTNYGLDRFCDGSFDVYLQGDGLFRDYITCLLPHPSGELWIGTDWGVAAFDGTGFRPISLETSREKPYVLDMILDRDGAVWVATHGDGIVRITEGAPRIYGKANGMASTHIGCLFEDRWGNLWVGTTDVGILAYSGTRFSLLDSSDGLADAEITCILETRDGDLWLGSWGSGISRRRNGGVETYTSLDGLVSDNLYCLTEGDLGDLWIGTLGGVCQWDGSRFHDQRSLFGEEITRDIFVDADGHVWVTSLEAPLMRFDGSRVLTYGPDEGLENTMILDVHQDASGIHWFGAFGEIIRFDGATFDAYPIEGGIIDDRIFQILEEPGGRFWLGTRGGLVLFIPPSEAGGPEWRRFPRSAGIRDQSLSLLVLDRRNDLWIGGSQGLDRLTFGPEWLPKAVRHFGIEEGLLGVECSHKSAAAARDGSLWFGMRLGALHYDPGAPYTEAEVPLTHILRLRLFLEPISVPPPNPGLPDSIELPHDQNHLTFDYTGIALPAASQVRYQYKMEGLDRGWSPETPDRRATYASLTDGEYVFHVRSRRGRGPWSPAASLPVHIRTPFWRAWWFLLLLLSALLAATFGIVHLRVRTTTRSRICLEETVAKRTEELERARTELEAQVHERTLELRDLNTALEAELSERRRIQEALIHSEKRFRTLFENAPIGLYRARMNGGLLMANRALLDMVGSISERDMKYKNLHDILFADPAVRNRFLQVLGEKGIVTPLETRWDHPQHGECRARISARIVEDREKATDVYEGFVERIPTQSKPTRE